MRKKGRAGENRGDMLEVVKREISMGQLGGGRGLGGGGEGGLQNERISGEKSRKVSAPL